MNATGKTAGPIPGTGDVNVSFGTKYKGVSINVQTFGDRPTATFSRTPSPSSEDMELVGNAHIGGFDVVVDWPAGATEPSITITP